MSGLRARLYLIRRNNLQRQEERGEVRQTSARIINAGVALAAANVSRRVGSATSSNSLLCHSPPPLPSNSSPLLTTVFFFPPARSSSPNYCRASFNFLLFFSFLCVCVRARCHGGFMNAHLRFGDERGVKSSRFLPCH